MVAHPDGRMDEAVVSMSRSKSRVSRQWNSLIRINGHDRFSRAYKLASAVDKSEKGEFYNFKVTTLGFVNEEQYRRAEKTFQIISEGRASIDRTEEGGSGSAMDEY